MEGQTEKMEKTWQEMRGGRKERTEAEGRRRADLVSDRIQVLTVHTQVD